MLETEQNEANKTLKQPFYTTLFNRYIFVDKDGNIDEDFIRLAKKQQNLTFDTRYLDPAFKDHLTTLTPFKEITFFDNYPDFSDSELFTDVELNYEALLGRILSTYMDGLRQLDTSGNYLVLCSNGSDSRILTGCLARLRDEEGFNLDNFIFHCWGRAEKDSFLQMMHEKKIKNYTIMDDNGPDPYKLAPLDFCTYGFNDFSMGMKFWDEHPPKKYCLLSGNNASMFDKTFEYFLHSRSWFDTRDESVYRMKQIFNDLFFPNMQKKLIALLASVPRKYKGIKDSRLQRDKLRTDLVFKLGLGNIPMQKTLIHFNLNDDIKKQWQQRYENSLFYKEYGVKLNFNKVLKEWWRFDNCLFCFACTTYEKIFA